MTTPEPDPDFLCYSRTASPEAFQRLVEDHLPAVHSAARRILGSKCDQAEDVAQLVFLRLAKKGRTLPETIVLGAWLHRQTVRLSLNTLRREARRLAREQHAAEMQFIERSLSSSGPDWPELVPQLDKAILDLPEKDRAAIALRFGERRKVREVAQRLGVSTAAAEKRIARALEKLRGKLTRRGVALSSVTGLALMLTQHSAEAAPVSLASTIVNGTAAAVEASAASPGIISIITTMAYTKSLSVGALAGLIFGGALITLSSARPDRSPSGSSMPGGGDRSITRVTGGARPTKQKIWVAPEPASTVAAVFGQLCELLNEPDNEITRLRMRGLLLQLPPDQFASLLKLVDKKISKDWESKRVLPEIAKAWAGVDPTAAIAGMVSSRGGYYVPENLASMAFSHWHSSQPLAAQDWLVVNQKEGIYSKSIPLMINVVATSLAAESEEKVVRWAAQISGNDFRRAALSALWSPYIRDFDTNHSADLSRLVESFAEVGDPEFSRTALRSMSEAWAHWRTHEFVTWLKTLEPGAGSFDATLVMVRESHRHSRKSRPLIEDEMHMNLKRLALRLADPERDRTDVVAEIVTESRKITRDGAAWAIPLMEEGPVRDAAILKAAKNISHKRDFELRYPPALLALEWVRHHSDPEERERLTAHYLDLWENHPKRTPEEVRPHLKEGDWSDEVNALVR